MAIHYNGGKGGSGVYQKIISMMPPHKFYIEPFLGNGSVLRYKKPALMSWAIDDDDQVINNLWENHGIENLKLTCGNALYWLKQDFYITPNPDETLIYCDPPYLMETRKSQRQLYRCEMSAEDEHYELLQILLSLKCNVMISSYQNDLYDNILSGWRVEHFTTTNRRGNRTNEFVYLNFPEPLELHDYSYLGENHRKRVDLKRQKKRWVNKFKNLPAQQRYNILAALEEMKPSKNGTNAVGADELQLFELPADNGESAVRILN